MQHGTEGVHSSVIFHQWVYSCVVKWWLCTVFVWFLVLWLRLVSGWVSEVVKDLNFGEFWKKNLYSASWKCFLVYFMYDVCIVPRMWFFIVLDVSRVIFKCTKFWQHSPFFSVYFLFHSYFEDKHTSWKLILKGLCLLTVITIVSGWLCVNFLIVWTLPSNQLLRVEVL